MPLGPNQWVAGEAAGSVGAVLEGLGAVVVDWGISLVAVVIEPTPLGATSPEGSLGKALGIGEALVAPSLLGEIVVGLWGANPSLTEPVVVSVPSPGMEPARISSASWTSLLAVSIPCAVGGLVETIVRGNTYPARATLMIVTPCSFNRSMSC